MYLHPLSLNPRYAYSALLTPPFLRRSDLFNKLRLSRLCSWNAGKLLTGMPKSKKKILPKIIVCVCSFCFYFADAFGNAMWSDHRAAVPQGSGVLHYLASSLLAFASRAPSNSIKYFSSYNRWKSRAREHSLTAFPVFPFTLLFICYI